MELRPERGAGNCASNHDVPAAGHRAGPLAVVCLATGRWGLVAPEAEPQFEHSRVSLPGRGVELRPERGAGNCASNHDAPAVGHRAQPQYPQNTAPRPRQGNAQEPPHGTDPPQPRPAGAGPQPGQDPSRSAPHRTAPGTTAERFRAPRKGALSRPRAAPA
ncbi:hypothetical protein Sm713_14720 [Streptomyces sp. TS71-3]|nr:hypothetical protein Sm713_14720 [Streptomyces sp. TS71-3]